MTEERPTVKLTGRNGNAYMILGLCQKAAREAGWAKDKIERVLDEMRSGDYNHLLVTAMKYFDVE